MDPSPTKMNSDLSNNLSEPDSNLTSQLDKALDTVNSSQYLTVDLICTVISLVLILPIVLGNSLVLLSIFKYHRLHTPTHVLIASLAIADLLVGIVTIPSFSLVHHARLGLETNYTSCLISYILSHCPTGVSLLTLLTIAIERYVAVHHPYKYHRLFKRKTAILMVIFIWVYIWSLGCVTMFLWNNWKSSSTDCNFADVASGKYMMSIAGHMLGVLLVTTVLHLAVAHTAWKVRKEIIKQAQAVSNATTLEHDARVARMLALVLGIFYLCWVPYILTLPFAGKVDGIEPFWLHVWEQFAGIVVLSNSCFNPIIYAWKNQDFRMAFRKLLGMKGGRAGDGVTYVNRGVVHAGGGRDEVVSRSADPNVDRHDGSTHCTRF